MCSQLKSDVLVYSYFPDAIFQYKSEWLKQQSLDVYIPSIKVAIEYQGQQHYQEIDYFGGKSGYLATHERDLQKKKVCENQGITLLEWPYTDPPVSIHFVQMMRQLGIELSNRFLFTDRFEAYEIGIIPNSLPSEKEILDAIKTNDSVFRKYSLDGKYIAEYSTIEQAALENHVKAATITAACNGRRKSVGGFQWRKCNSMEPASDTTPVKKSGSGPVYQINSDGEIIGEYASSSQAGKAIGIDGKNIRDVANGYQKTAGGYYWMFKERENLEEAAEERSRESPPFSPLTQN